MTHIQIGKYTFIAALTGLAALCLMPSAYADPDAIERCRQVATDQERIACLEAALRGSQPESEEVDEPEVAAEQPQPESLQPPPVETARSDPSESVELGAEQVAARTAPMRASDPSPRLNAAIRSAEHIPYQRLQVTLDNGQVWRQIRGDTQRIDVRNANEQTVEVWQSNFGGYRMRLNEMARTIRVERIR